MVAIEGGSLAVVQELIIKGVDIDVADARGRNVFHYAATGSNTAIIKVFVLVTRKIFIAVVSRGFVNINKSNKPKQLDMDGWERVHLE